MVVITDGQQHSNGAAASTSLEEVGVSTATANIARDREIKAQMGPNVSQSIRNAFIRKVYAILTTMLLITTLIAVPFQFLSAEWITQHRAVLAGLMWGSLILTLAMACCCIKAMRNFPANYIFLFVFSVCYGVICGCVAMSYTLPSVLLAAGMTAAIFSLLTAYACTTKTDFTGMGPYLFAALFGLIIFGLFVMIFSWIWPGMYSTAHMIYAALGAILFSFYIVYDTQLIVGGEHKKHQFSVDDYAFAALNLYLDIINLFLMLLSLFGSRK